MLEKFSEWYGVLVSVSVLEISPVSSVKRIFKIRTAINTISNSSMSVLMLVESVLIALNVQ